MHSKPSDYITMQEQDAIIQQITITLTTARHSPKIWQALVEQAVNEYTINQLEDQLGVVHDLSDQYDNTIAEGEITKQSLYAAHDEGRKRYDQHLELARVALKDAPAWLEKMELNGPQPKSLSAWIRRASSFYHHAPTVQDTLTAHRIPAKEVIEMQRLLGRMIALRALQVDLKERGRVLSRQKKRATATLQRNMSRFHHIAHFVFEKKPRHLRALGLTKESSGLIAGYRN